MEHSTLDLQRKAVAAASTRAKVDELPASAIASTVRQGTSQAKLHPDLVKRPYCRIHKAVALDEHETIVLGKELIDSFVNMGT